MGRNPLPTKARLASDTGFMDGFLTVALELLELSQSAGMQDGGTEEIRILMGGECGTLIIMQTTDDWTLEALRLHHGAAVAYRIGRNTLRTRLEGMSAAQSCSLDSAPQPEPWQQLLGTNPYPNDSTWTQTGGYMFLEGK